MAQRYSQPTVQEFDTNGDPLSGGKLNFYSTGTLDRKDTFSDSALSVANSNPVIADSAGRFGNIFLGSGTYRVVLTDADDVEIYDRDPVDGAAGTSGVVDEKTGDYTVTSSDSTKILSFDVSAASVTASLLAAATAGNGYELTIEKTDSSSNTVTLDPNGSEEINGAASIVLNKQYASVTIRSDGVNWHIVSATNIVLSTINTNSHAIEFSEGAAVASATAPNIWVTDGNTLHITGTTQIDDFADAPRIGSYRWLIFDDAVTITDGSGITIGNGGANATTVAGDMALVYADAIDAFRLFFFSGQATQAAVLAQTNQNTYVPPDLIRYNPGIDQAKIILTSLASSPPTLTTVFSKFGTITVGRDSQGIYTLTFPANFASTAYAVQVSCADTSPRVVNYSNKAVGSVKIRAVTDAGASVDPATEITVTISGPLA